MLHSDSLSWVMAGLIVFVVAIVTAFSRRYMAGDNNHGRHTRGVLLLGLSLLVVVFADSLVLLLAGWGTSNLLLVRLMVHKDQWQAARASGRLAFRTFLGGFLLLALAFGILGATAGTPSIRAIVSQADRLTDPQITLAMVLIAVAAMTQSAAWPFHRWLLSSLNSPTPVSALMHAGLVNGGGFLLVRFAPLYQARPAVLHALFIAGLLSAVVGSFWKLMQTDIKRMLACSTMGQMGFMIMQCGLGLFSPAVSHLCWHGLFKAYLFLSSASAVREKRSQGQFGRPAAAGWAIAGVIGAAGACAFVGTSVNSFRLTDTGAVMIGIAFMACTQLAASILEHRISPRRMLLALVSSLAGGSLYGASIGAVELALEPLEGFRPLPLDAIYLAGLVALFSLWAIMNMKVGSRLQNSSLWKRLYVVALNGSQPHPRTVTSARTGYQY